MNPTQIKFIKLERNDEEASLPQKPKERANSRIIKSSGHSDFSKNIELLEMETSNNEDRNKMEDFFKGCKLLEKLFKKDHETATAVAKEFASKAKFHFISKGEPLFQAGEKKISIFFIMKGTTTLLFPKRIKQMQDQKITKKEMKKNQFQGSSYSLSKNETTFSKSQDYIPFSETEESKIIDENFLRKSVLWLTKSYVQPQEVYSTKKNRTKINKFINSRINQNISNEQQSQTLVLPNIVSQDISQESKEEHFHQQKQDTFPHQKILESLKKEEASPSIRNQSYLLKMNSTEETSSTRKNKLSILKKVNTSAPEQVESSPQRKENISVSEDTSPKKKISSLKRGNATIFDEGESSPQKKKSSSNLKRGNASVFEEDESSPSKKKSASPLKRGNTSIFSQAQGEKTPSKKIEGITSSSHISPNHNQIEEEQEEVENVASEDSENESQEDQVNDSDMAFNEEFQACFSSFKPSDIRDCFSRFFVGSIFKFNFGKVLQEKDNTDLVDILQKQQRITSCIATSNVHAAELEKCDILNFMKKFHEVKLLKKVGCIFRSFETYDIAYLKKLFLDNSEYFIKKKYKRDQYIFKEGEVSQGLYILKSGEVEITKYSKTNLPQQFFLKNQFFNWQQFTIQQEVSLATVQVGQFFGEEDTLKNRMHRVINSKCKSSKCTLYYLPNLHLLRIMYESRDFIDSLKEKTEMKEEWYKKKYENLQQILESDQIATINQNKKESQKQEYEDAQVMEGMFRDTLEKVEWKQSVDQEKRLRENNQYQQKGSVQKQDFIKEKLDILSNFLKKQSNPFYMIQQQSQQQQQTPPLLLSTQRSRKNSSLNISQQLLKKQSTETSQNPLLTNTKIQKLLNQSQKSEKLLTIRNQSQVFKNAVSSSQNLMKKSVSLSNINSSNNLIQKQESHFNSQKKQSKEFNESNNSNIILEERANSPFLSFRELQREMNQSENFIKIISSLQTSPKRGNSPQNQSKIFESESRVFLTSAPTSLIQQLSKESLPLQTKELEDRQQRNKINLNANSSLNVSQEKKQLDSNKSKENPNQSNIQDKNNANNINFSSFNVFKQVLGRSKAQAISNHYLRKIEEKQATTAIKEMEEQVKRKEKSIGKVEAFGVSSENIEKIAARINIMRGVKKQKSMSIHSQENGLHFKFEGILIKIKNQLMNRERVRQLEESQFIPIQNVEQPKNNEGQDLIQEFSKIENIRRFSLQNIYPKSKDSNCNQEEQSQIIEKNKPSERAQNKSKRCIKINKESYSSRVSQDSKSQLRKEKTQQKQEPQNCVTQNSINQNQNNAQKSDIFDLKKREINNQRSITESQENLPKESTNIVNSKRRSTSFKIDSYQKNKSKLINEQNQLENETKFKQENNLGNQKIQLENNKIPVLTVQLEPGLIVNDKKISSPQNTKNSSLIQHVEISSSQFQKGTSNNRSEGNHFFFNFKTALVKQNKHIVVSNHQGKPIIYKQKGK